MKIAIAFLSICVVVFGTTLCMAQTRDSGGTTNSGNIVQDVHLAISATNSVVEIGASITVIAVITNSSTNAILLADTGGTTDFDFVLTSTTGQVFDLTPKEYSIPKRTTFTLNAGESHNWIVPVNVGKKVGPGDYTLRATRYFFFGDNHFTLSSNALKVQIK
jgi:hypothetical protein